MSENYEQLLVNSETIEPFILCLALGTLEVMQSRVWSSEAGIWTIAPSFLNKLEELNVSDETINILVEFDELNALEQFVAKDDFEQKLLKVEQNIKKRLEDFSENFWYAKWSPEI